MQRRDPLSRSVARAIPRRSATRRRASSAWPDPGRHVRADRDSCRPRCPGRVGPGSRAPRSGRGARPRVRAGAPAEAGPRLVWARRAVRPDERRPRARQRRGRAARAVGGVECREGRSDRARPLRGRCSATTWTSPAIRSARLHLRGVGAEHRRRARRRRPTHGSFREPAYPGQLALQYWFFYVFNDYNDKHEGDWEMIQLDFDCDGRRPRRSGRTPSRSDTASIRAAPSARRGARRPPRARRRHAPVVYPAAGSHANYFSPDLYLGRSAAQGSGCDDTTGPSCRSTAPTVAVIPTDPARTWRLPVARITTGAGARSRPGSTTVRRAPTRSCNGPSPPLDGHQWRQTRFAIPAAGVGDGRDGLLLRFRRRGLRRFSARPRPTRSRG